MKSIFLISFSIATIAFSSCTTTKSLICPGLQEVISRIALEGYAESRLGNYHEADSLFKRALDLTRNCEWPVYNSQAINESIPKWIQEQTYDWQASDVEKIVGLMQVYYSVKYYFGGFEMSPQLNWDELVRDYIPKIIESNTIGDYYKLLLTLISNLNDNHTWLRLPASLEERHDRPPISILILDVRENEGGNFRAGDAIISHIVEKPFDAWSFKMRTKGPVETISNPFLRAGARIVRFLSGKEWHQSTHTIAPGSGKRYLGPVVVLVSRYTGSAAEQFVVAARESKRAILIGETTSGGTGDGVFSILPGYGKLKVCTGTGAYTDGHIWQGKGIEPDITISRTVEDIRTGHDPVLAKAIEFLRDSINKKK